MPNIDLSSQIRSMYAKQLADKIAAQNASNDAAKQPYQYNISQAGKTYQPKYNEAYTTNAVQGRALRERLANLGMGAAGGVSQRKTTDLSNSFLGNLTGIGLDKQNYINAQNSEMSKLDANNQAKVADITAQNGADMNAALMGDKKRLEGIYLSLYLNGNLSEKQYNDYINALNAA